MLTSGIMRLTGRASVEPSSDGEDDEGVEAAADRVIEIIITRSSMRMLDIDDGDGDGDGDDIDIERSNCKPTEG